jgi:hypothetical protein
MFSKRSLKKSYKVFDFIPPPIPYTGDGFVVYQNERGKLRVVFDGDIVEWNPKDGTEVRDITSTCRDMARLQKKMHNIWRQINRVGVDNGMVLTEKFATDGFYPNAFR